MVVALFHAKQSFEIRRRGLSPQEVNGRTRHRLEAMGQTPATFAVHFFEEMDQLLCQT
jgi:hypothetical protein